MAGDSCDCFQAICYLLCEKVPKGLIMIHLLTEIKSEEHRWNQQSSENDGKRPISGVCVTKQNSPVP